MVTTSKSMQREVVTIDLHYITDKQERFDLKTSKLKLGHLGKLKHTKY